MRNSEGRLGNQIENPHSLRFNVPYNTPHNVYYPPQFIPMAQQLPTGSHLNSYMFTPFYQIPNPMLVNGAHNIMPMSNNNNYNPEVNRIPVDPNVKPSNVTKNQTSFTCSRWSDLQGFYDGAYEDRPTAGHLTNGKYFAQRSAGKDIYMVFNSISDYINNFVNYYFSNKNFSNDETLLNLMDEQGVVELSDLIKFPRLAQIGTKVDDVIEALKFNNIVILTKKTEDVYGVKRKDGWFPKRNTDDFSKTDSKSSQKIDNHEELRASNQPSHFNQDSSNGLKNSLPNDIRTSQVDPNVLQNPMLYLSPSGNIMHPVYAPFFQPHPNIQPNIQPQNILSNNFQFVFPNFQQHPQPMYAPNQSLQYQQVFPAGVSELSGNPILYQTNLKPLIGAGGNNNVLR